MTEIGYNKQMNHTLSSSHLPLAEARILLGISGGIAAYKSVDLARKLVQAGAEVRVVLTASATHFVSTTALQAVTGHEVRQALWDETAEAAMSHIELARWATCVLVAPATAGLMARMAQGMADDLLTTLLLATQAPVLIAPAMNGHMWRHAATQDNLATLVQRGVQYLMPESGSLACGDVDVGRLPAVEVIVEWLASHFVAKVWQGKRILITAGPTVEDIDPVRFIANRSSGKMGYALAAAAASMGAEVCLISGPTHLSAPIGVRLIAVRSAEEMFTEVQAELAAADVFIAAAAVADYRVAQPASQKLKKQGDAPLTLTLEQNPDIVAWAAQQSPRGRVVAFAAETEQVSDNARQKLVRKGVDAILANSVAGGAVFEQDDNQLLLITDEIEQEFPLTSKQQLAQQVLYYFAQLWQQPSDSQ